MSGPNGRDGQDWWHRFEAWRTDVLRAMGILPPPPPPPSISEHEKEARQASQELRKEMLRAVVASKRAARSMHELLSQIDERDAADALSALLEKRDRDRKQPR